MSPDDRPPAAEPRAPHATPSTLALAVGVTISILAVSTAASLICLSSAGPMAIAFYRLLIATVLIGAFGLASDRTAFRGIRKADWGVLILAGALLALHFATWIASLALTSVAASLFLVTTHPVMVGLASHARGERMKALGWAGILVALLGGFAIIVLDALAPTASACSQGPSALTGLVHGTSLATAAGDLLAVAGAIAIAAYLLVARSVRQRMDLIPYTTITYATASVVLLLAALADREPLMGFDARNWGIFLLLALIPMILGHTVLNWAIRWVPAPIISTTILGEPVAGTVLAVVWLGQVPTVSTVIAGIVILVGIALVIRGQSQGPAEAVG
ncbi:MAG: DMT family transporter [Thermoplasmatota archaeon]